LSLPFLAALSSVFHDPAAGIIGTILLALPVFGAELLSVELARVTGLLSAGIVLIAVLCVLIFLYYSGYLHYQTAMDARKWTEASLSLGLLPLKGAAILIVPLLLTVIATKMAKSKVAR
jgi:hypothetical protein